MAGSHLRRLAERAAPRTAPTPGGPSLATSPDTLPRRPPAVGDPVVAPPDATVGKPAGTEVPSLPFAGAGESRVHPAAPPVRGATAAGTARPPVRGAALRARDRAPGPPMTPPPPKTGRRDGRAMPVPPAPVAPPGTATDPSPTRADPAGAARPAGPAESPPPSRAPTAARTPTLADRPVVAIVELPTRGPQVLAPQAPDPPLPPPILAAAAAPADRAAPAVNVRPPDRAAAAAAAAAPRPTRKIVQVRIGRIDLVAAPAPPPATVVIAPRRPVGAFDGLVAERTWAARGGQ
jgi:hypothetical protein